MCETCDRINFDQPEPPRRTLVPLSKQRAERQQRQARERYNNGDRRVLRYTFSGESDHYIDALDQDAMGYPE